MTVSEQRETTETPRKTVVGWQGLRFTLPADWNVTGFSMDRDNGYLRVDAPGDSTLTVQVRWTNAARQQPTGIPNMYTWLAPKMRQWFRRPDPPTPESDLKTNLEKILKDAAKDAKKSGQVFDSTLRSEKTEGPDSERRAMNFSWSGVGRGQGKIWQCATCNRVVVAQVIGMAKDQSAIAPIASQLFGSLRDHAEDGFEHWALYDLEVEIPKDFRLYEQKLHAGFLHLAFARQGEKIVVQRWGLASIALKKFSVSEWLHANSIVDVKGLAESNGPAGNGHIASRISGSLTLGGRLKALRSAKGSLRRFPTRYDGGAWECKESNKLFAIQILHSAKTSGLWEDVAARCLCHAAER